MRREIARAPDAGALAALCRQGMPRLLLALVEAGLAPRDVSRVLTVQSDAATLRLIAFALDEHGPAPVPWAWLALGSVARRELTLGLRPGQRARLRRRRRRRGGRAHGAPWRRTSTRAWRRAGSARTAPRCSRADPRWRMTESAWRHVFRDCLERPDRSGLVRAAVAFDFRHAAGGLEIVPPLVSIMREAPGHADFVRRLARTATDVRVPSPADLRRTRFRRATPDARPQARRRAPDRQPRALPRARQRRDDLGDARPPRGGGGARGARPRHGDVAARGVPDRLAAPARAPRGVRPPRAARRRTGSSPPTSRRSPREELFSALRAIGDAQKQLSVYAPLGI